MSVVEKIEMAIKEKYFANKSFSKWSDKQYSGVIDSIFSDTVVYSQILEVN